MFEDEANKLKTLRGIAETCVLEWWPDTKSYPKEKRMAELALMKMLVDLEPVFK